MTAKKIAELIAEGYMDYNLDSNPMFLAKEYLRLEAEANAKEEMAYLKGYKDGIAWANKNEDMK